MGRALLLLISLLAWGCSSAAEAPPPRPLVLAVLPAPNLQPLDALEEEAEAGLVGGDFLLEVATQLSAEARLDLCFVPAPLLGGGEALAEEALEEVLIAVSDGLGQIAAPVYLGLSSEDANRARLLETLKESVRDHPGQASVWGKAVLGWRPVSLAAGVSLSQVEEEARAEAARAKPAANEGDGNEGEDGEEGDDEDEAARAAEVATPLLLVLGDPATQSSDPRTRLRVVAGDSPELVAQGGVLELRVPTSRAGLYALAVLHPDRIELEWRSVEPERVAPPAPVSLPWVGGAKAR